MTSQLNPYISFDGNAREAMEFYQDVLGGELTMHTFGEYGDPSAPEAEKIMHGMLQSDLGFTLMGADTPPGMPYNPGDNIAISLSGDDADSCAATGRGCPTAATSRSPGDADVGR